MKSSVYDMDLVLAVVREFEGRFSTRDVVARVQVAHPHIEPRNVASLMMHLWRKGKVRKVGMRNRRENYYEPVAARPVAAPQLSQLEAAWREFRAGLTVHVPELEFTAGRSQ